MANIKDTIQMPDTVTAALDQSTNVVYPCKKCNKATKEHVGPAGTRICSNPICEDRKAMKSVHVSELTATAFTLDSARFPCPKCSRESKEHVGPPGSRICAMPLCRHEFRLLVS